MGRFKAACAAACFFLLGSAAHAAFKFLTPANGATVLGSTVTVDIRNCGGREIPQLKLVLDNEVVDAQWKRGPYDGQMFTHLTLVSEGRHQVTVSGNCFLFSKVETRAFVSRKKGTIDLAYDLANHYMYEHPATSVPWNWGPGVFLYALSRLPGTESYLHDYYAHHVAKGIKTPSKSDNCTGGLGALELFKRGDNVGVSAAEAVAHYIRTAPRNALGALNHLGDDFFSFIYPNTIWVDSLMMYAIFATQWGKQMNDPALYEFGLKQPIIFASALMDTRYGLFRHAYFINSGERLPGDPGFWLRGNGWVMVALVEILDQAVPGSPEAQQMISMLQRMAYSMAWYQTPNGLWDSIANIPGYSYGETSGTAMVAYSMARGVHRGWLHPGYMQVAKRAFSAVTARLQPKKVGLSMPGMSWSTNPMPVSWYKLVPQVSDFSYGVGAYLMAADEFKDEEF